MSFVTFMNGAAGRTLRIVAGLALIGVGLTAVGGAAAVVLAVVGLVALAAGALGICLAGPLLGSDLHGRTGQAAIKDGRTS